MTVLGSALLTGLLVLSAALMLAPRHGVARRLRRLLGFGSGTPAAAAAAAKRNQSRRGMLSIFAARASRLPGGQARSRESQDAMTLAVQQMAALLKGGRNPARLWEELMLVHGGPSTGESARTLIRTRGLQRVEAGNTLGGASLDVLAAARGAAKLGAPVSAAIRNAAQRVSFLPDNREQRVWFDVAACLDVADASGCPLADVLSRLAAQLEVEDDAEAARQTALAGPKSTVTLLSWLPLTGLGLGIALGVDPVAILLNTPIGIAALLTGAVLTVAGRVWSARLVRSAAAGLG